MAFKDRTLAFGRMLENTPVSANKNVQWPDGSELPKVTLERHPSFLAFIRTKEALLRRHVRRGQGTDDLPVPRKQVNSVHSEVSFVSRAHWVIDHRSCWYANLTVLSCT